MTELMVSIYIFVLAIFVGFEVINKVPPLLHTPLMSGSNALSGVTLVGALITAGMKDLSAAKHLNLELLIVVLAVVAIVCATINVVGGFLVTDRMLEMFKSKKK